MTAFKRFWSEDHNRVALRIGSLGLLFIILGLLVSVFASADIPTVLEASTIAYYPLNNVSDIANGFAHATYTYTCFTVTFT